MWLAAGAKMASVWPAMCGAEGASLQRIQRDIVYISVLAREGPVSDAL